MKKLTLIIALLAGFTYTMQAQDDLLQMLEDGDETVNYTSATFKGTRVINTQSVENPHKNVLQFMIQHRFGTINKGPYEFFGLDQATMRLGFDYGINDYLAIGIGRSTTEKTLDGNVKWKILRQCTGKKKIPITLVYNAGMYVNGLKYQDPTRVNYFSSKVSYMHQIIIGRKFNDKTSLQISPMLIHKNLVATAADYNDNFAFEFGGRQKISKRISINLDYVYFYDRNSANNYTNSLSMGVDIETGGHVFQLQATNSRAMFERGFVTETTGKWSKGDIYFGFNISRVFTLGSKH